MPALTPQFLFEFERRMRAITENEYARFASNAWWQKITKIRKAEGKAERVAWLLSTAQIKATGKGGNITFDDIVSQTTEYEPLHAGAGLKLKRDQLEDLDGTGLELGGKWSSDIGAYMAYWPQKQVAAAITAGETGTAYDGQAFFSTAHPLNPFNTGAGNYANLYTGASSGSYPGALPIDESVSVDVALQNLGKAVAAIASIKMPNGEDPRFLRPRSLLVPPRLVPRAQQLTNAKFIAQAASGGAGAADIEKIVSNWGFAEPIEVQEFAGSDTTWYLACEEIQSTELGSILYVERKPFKITYYTGDAGGTGVDAILDRAQELEWHCDGRNVTSYGHPYALHKFKAT